MRAILTITLTFLVSTVFCQEYARIVDSETIYSVIDVNQVEIIEKYKIKILSEKGKHFSVYRNFSDEFRKITNVSITIFDSSGKKVRKLNKTDGHEYGFGPSNEITDGKMLVIDPSYQQYPFTMEVSSKVELNGYLTLPTWMPQYYFHLGVEKASLKVERPVDFKLNFLEKGVEGSEEITDGQKINFYSLSELASADERSKYSEFIENQPKVMVAPSDFKMDGHEGKNESWKDFGDWFLSLNNKAYTLKESTKSSIRALEGREKEEIVKVLYKLMQDQTRYVSIQLGIGGFESIPTEQVENLGYGDCKALTTYMKNMLDYAGIESNYILVKAGRDVPDVISGFPSSQFNHVFLGVPLENDTILLECTNQELPTGHTGSFTDDRNVLWVKQGSSEIIRSRVYRPKDNIQKSVAEIYLNKDGDAVLQLDVYNSGIFFDELMLYQNAGGNKIEEYNLSLFNYKDFTIDNFDFNQEQRDEPVFEKRYNITINGLGKKIGDRLIFPANILRPVEQFVEFDIFKKYASVKRGITIVDEVKVRTDENFWVQNLDLDQNFKNPVGSFEISFEKDGKNVVIRRKVIISKGIYLNDEFDVFLDFHKAVKKIEGRKIVLNSKT
ncbi:MAG: hypothetical protein NXI20_16735 [bacterium]|nr:hypothetical protein [bacterium]